MASAKPAVRTGRRFGRSGLRTVELAEDVDISSKWVLKAAERPKI